MDDSLNRRLAACRLCRARLRDRRNPHPASTSESIRALYMSLPKITVFVSPTARLVWRWTGALPFEIKTVVEQRAVGG